MGQVSVVRFWPGNEARRLGSISSFTARRIWAIPLYYRGSMSAVSAALLAMLSQLGACWNAGEKRTIVGEIPPKRRSEMCAAIVRGASATLDAVADEAG